VYVALAAGAVCALCVAAWFHLDHGLASRDARNRSARSPFPLVVHEIWLGEEMPAVKRLLYQRNEEVLSPWGWHLQLWGLGDVTRQNFPRTFNTITRGLEHHARTGQNTFSMVGDLMKFEILFRHGGLYLDTNVEMLRDPSPLFWDTASAGREAFFVADPGDNRFISAGMIGALAPGSRLLRRVVENSAYLDGVDFAQHCIANALTGPVMLTMHLEHDRSLLETVSVFDRDVAYPIACGENYLDPCMHQLSEGKKTAAAGFTSAASKMNATLNATVAADGVVDFEEEEEAAAAAEVAEAEVEEAEDKAAVTRVLEGRSGSATGMGTVVGGAAAAVARSMGSVGTAALGDVASIPTNLHSPLLPLRSLPPPPLPPGHQHAPHESSNDNNDDDVNADTYTQHRRIISTMLDHTARNFHGIAGFISDVHGGIAGAASGITASLRKHRVAAARTRNEMWRRHSVHMDAPAKLVVENDGSTWNVTLPCRAIAHQYPDSYAIDHFSVGGASWQQNCDRYQKASDIVAWVEKHVPPNVDLVHKWAMSAVRYLGGPEHARELVRRVRLHQTGGVPGKARLLLVASSLRSGGALLNEMLETTADHPVDSKIWYRDDGARTDAFFVAYITLGDLWSHGAFHDVKRDSWQARLRTYLNASGVSARAVAEAHVDPVGFLDEVLLRMWELGIDLVHVMLAQSQLGSQAVADEEEAIKEGRGEARTQGQQQQVATAAGVGAEGGGVVGNVEGREGVAADNVPLNNSAVLDALLKRFPDSPTVCLKRRNMLDAYVSLYRAEHGETPWQLVAEPPPAPIAGAPSSNGGDEGVAAVSRALARATDVNEQRTTGVWELQQQQEDQQGDQERVDGESPNPTGDHNENVDEDLEEDKQQPGHRGEGTEQSHQRWRGRQPSAEAFGAFGPLPTAAAAAAAVAVETGQSPGATSESQGRGGGATTWLPHLVRFDPVVFNRLERLETKWLAHVAARTRELGRECEEVVYEDDLIDERRQAQTLTRLRDRLNLDINVEALPLQKLRRISTVPVTLQDFENPDQLGERARSFLHQIPEEGSR
jgi:hypothetical protein